MISYLFDLFLRLTPSFIFFAIYLFLRAENKIWHEPLRLKRTGETDIRLVQGYKKIHVNGKSKWINAFWIPEKYQ